MKYHKPNFLEVALFVGLLSGPPSFRGRDATASLRGELDLASGIQVAVWLLGLAWVVWLAFKRKGKVPLPGLPQVLGILVSATFMVSALTSPSPPFTLFRSLQVLIAVIFTFFWAYRFGPRRTLQLYIYTLTLLIVSIFVSYLVNPDFVVRGDRFGLRVKADWITPAAPLAILIMAYLIAPPLRLALPLRLGLAVLAFALFILARNRTAFVAVGMLAALSILTISKKWSPFWKFITVGSLGVVSILLVIGVDPIVAWVVRNPNQISTFSARIPLWDYLITNMIQRSPIIGLGFYAASRVLGPQAVPGLGNAHSTFIEVLVGGGFLSLGFYLAIWAWIGVKFLRALGRYDRTRYTYINMMLVIFLFGLTTSYGITVSVLSFSFWLVLAIWVQQARSNSQQHAGNIQAP